MMLNTMLFAVGPLLFASASAQQSAWGQCGGTGWTGAKTCVSGYVCQAQNHYYSQCVPGAGTTLTSSSRGSTSTSKKDATTSTKVSTTSIKATPTTSSSTTSAAPSSTTRYLISFGDSYSQTGFDPTLSLPSQSNPLGNPTFPGWTTSGGPNWIGYYITQFNSSPVYSYNFASGGATTDAKLVTPFAPTVLSFVDQVDLYLRSVKREGFKRWNGDNALFAVWIGVNDVGNAWSPSTYTSLLSQIMDQYINQTQTLYDAGARRFLFLTVPPIQLSPTVQSQGAATVSAEGAAVKQYNDALAGRVKAFATKNAQAKTYVVDTTAPFLEAIRDPSKYGADNATCFDASGTRCLWWNDYHPGLAIHKLVAEAVSLALKP